MVPLALRCRRPGSVPDFSHITMHPCRHTAIYASRSSHKVCLEWADCCHDHTGEGPAQGEEAEGHGPLRMWPGGLCLSRAIGDFDVGENVLCAPHIQQVLVQLAELPLVLLMPMRLCFRQRWSCAMLVSCTHFSRLAVSQLGSHARLQAPRLL